MHSQSSPSITFPQLALSRVFVKTIGRLGRWRRVLNSRQTVDTWIAVPANILAFNLELSASGGLLGVRGGVEQYLKMIESPSCASGTKLGLCVEEEEEKEIKTRFCTSSYHLRCVSEVTEEEEDWSYTARMSRRRSSYKLSAISRATLSTRMHSTESFGSILSSRSMLNPLVTQVQAQPPWRFDVVSIDDLDLSDTSSEMHVGGGSACGSNNSNNNVHPPPGKKVPRKLLLRRDFEFIRRSGESVSLMGIRSWN